MWNQETNFPDTTSNLYILSQRSIFPYDSCSNFWWDILKNRPQVILSLLLSCIRLLQKIKRDKSFLRGSPLSKPCIHIHTIRYIVLINIFNNSNKLSIYNIECPSINIYFLYLYEYHYVELHNIRMEIGIRMKIKYMSTWYFEVSFINFRLPFRTIVGHPFIIHNSLKNNAAFII